MGGAIKVDWPDAYEEGMSKANFVNLNILGMVDTSCLFPPTNFFSKLVGNTVGPIVLSMLIFLYMFVTRARLYAKGGEAAARQSKEVTSSCMSTFFALTYLVFPSSSLQVFRAFGCDNVRGRADAPLTKFAHIVSCTTEIRSARQVWLRRRGPRKVRERAGNSGIVALGECYLRFFRWFPRAISRLPLRVHSTTTRSIATPTYTRISGPRTL